MSKYIWYRFKTKAIDDCRPLKDMADIQCPWWCTGEGMDYAIIVCYLPSNLDLKDYWDDAYDIDKEEKDEIIYSDRFGKPDWIK